MRSIMENMYLVEGTIDKIKDIVSKKQHSKIDGVTVDLFTASAISQIYDKVNDANKKKMEKLPINKLAILAMKMMKKEDGDPEDQYDDEEERQQTEEVDLDEGKMAQMHQMMKDKKSAAQIAKEMGLDVKTVKALMDGYNKMVPESFEIGTEKYLKHTVNVTPGQKEWTETVTKKADSMRETLAKMWGVDEGKNVFEKDSKKDLTSEVKGGTTMTGKKVADIDTKPTIKEKKK
jgi:hypothetical protein